MKIVPKDGYILVKKYVKATIPGKIILSKEDSYNNWAVLASGDRENTIVQIKPFCKMPIEGNTDLFLVKEEDVLAYIEE